MKSFEQLVTHFCAMKGLGDPEPVAKGAPVIVDGIEISLIYNETVDPAKASMLVTFGVAPMKNRGKIYKALLQENHIGFEGKGPGFCVSPATRQVMYVLHIRWGETMPDELANTMAYLAGKANEWKRTYFLNDPSRRAPKFGYLPC